MFTNLFLAAGSFSTGMSLLAGIFNVCGFVASGGALLFGGLSVVGERSLSTIKWALMLVGIAAAAFTLAGLLFTAFGTPVQITPTNPN